MTGPITNQLGYQGSGKFDGRWDVSLARSCRHTSYVDGANPNRMQTGSYCTDNTAATTAADGTITTQEAIDGCPSWSSAGGGFYTTTEVCPVNGATNENTLGTEWITEWNGWACWMHEENDQKINMGMSTVKGSICKASDMVDRIHVTDHGYSGSTSICKKSGFVLEHTLKGNNSNNIYVQAQPQQTHSYYGSTDYVLRGDSAVYEEVTSQGTYQNTQTPIVVHSSHVSTTPLPEVPDTGPYRVNVVRNGIDGSMTVAINGKTVLRKSMFVGQAPLQIWFQGDGASRFQIKNIVVYNRATNFIDYNLGTFSLRYTQPALIFKFSQLQMLSDGSDHLLVVARTPPWRVVEAFQIEDTKCLKRNCFECQANQDCLVCEHGWYLHGTTCLKTCPTNTRAFFVDQSENKLINSNNNLQKALSYTKHIATPTSGMTDTSTIGCQPTQSGTPIMGQGEHACMAFVDNQDTFWTSHLNGPVVPPKDDKWLGYHFNASEEIIGYTVGVHYNQHESLYGQWVFEGAKDKMDHSSIDYDDRVIDSDGWVVLDDAHQYESMYISKPPGTTNQFNCGHNGWTCPFTSANRNQNTVTGYTYQTQRVKTFAIPQTSVNSYNRYRLRFVSSDTGNDGANCDNSTKCGWDVKIWKLQLLKRTVTNTETNIKGRSCLGMEDTNVKISHIRSHLLFDAAKVTMPTKYDPPPQLFWGSSKFDQLKDPFTFEVLPALKTFKMPTNGLLRLTLPSTKKPLLASHLIAFNQFEIVPVSIAITDDIELTIVGDETSTLTVHSGNFTGTWETLAEGVLQFSDRDAYFLTDVPTELLGRKYFKGPCHSFAVSLVLTGSKLTILASIGNGASNIDHFSTRITPPPMVHKIFTSMKTGSFENFAGFHSWDMVGASWIDSMEIVDTGCSLISKLSNCAICNPARQCLKCGNNTYLDDHVCNKKCTNGRLPMGEENEMGRYCVGILDNAPSFGRLQGSYVVPNGFCEQDVRYTGTCTATTKGCPLTKVATTMKACNHLCDQDVACIGVTYESVHQSCWLWGQKSGIRRTPISSKFNYKSCPSSRQRQLLLDASTVTMFWDNQPHQTNDDAARTMKLANSAVTSNQDPCPTGTEIKDPASCLAMGVTLGYAEGTADDHGATHVPFC